ncbi:MAG: hypothetical protein VXX24_04940 [Pseudomonadota bacterium]|nr:hypothetical protein [Pseudomonadota bacterium]
MLLPCIIKLPQIAAKGHKHIWGSEVGKHVVTIGLQNLSQEKCTEGLNRKPVVAVVINATMENTRELPTAT